MKPVLIGVAVAALSVLPASAHPRAMPSPFTPFTPPHHATPTPPVRPTPASNGIKAGDTASIISALINAKGQVVSDLQQADTLASTINSATGSSWDAFSHMCLAGIPAVGTPGQPGYVPATPGLIAWVSGLQAPTIAGVPPMPANPSAATVFVHARLLVMAAQTDVSSVVTMLQTQGVPSSLKLACGSLINDVSTQAMQAAGQLAAFDALLVKFAAPMAVIP